MPKRLAAWTRAAVVRILLWLWVALAMVPLVWMVTTSFKPSGYAQTIPPTWIFAPTLEHYRDVLTGASATPFAPLLLHSLIVALLATAVGLALGLMAAYALARIQFIGKKFLAMWILSTLMFPPVVSVIPVFILAGRLGLIDKYITLAVRGDLADRAAARRARHRHRRHPEHAPVVERIPLRADSDSLGGQDRPGRDQRIHGHVRHPVGQLDRWRDDDRRAGGADGAGAAPPPDRRADAGRRQVTAARRERAVRRSRQGVVR
jgi:hypothetical protein